MSISKAARTALFVSVSMIPLYGALAADQAAKSGDNEELEQIFVSASRVEREGFEAPTPVTIVGREQITEAAAPYLADYLSSLPAFGAAMSNKNPTPNLSGGNTGLSLVNLRNLGVERTLVLFNGQRVVSANIINSGVDLNLIPTALVSRVDVVTGGASASWGSDAISGVVNVILNKKFSGLEVSTEGSMTTYGDAANYKIDLAGGHEFAGGRGHAIGSITWSETPGFTATGARSWYTGRTLMVNPAYTATNSEPRLIARNAGIGTGTQGGVITSGPLKGTQFVGPKGTPVPFDFGILSGTMSTGPDADYSMGKTIDLAQPLWRGSVFGYSSYDITDDITASFEINYSTVGGKNHSTPNYQLNNLVIQQDNAFLDPSIKARMQALGLTSFTMGTSAMNMDIPSAISWRKLVRTVVSLDGKFGDGWSWSAYYQRGRSQAKSIGENITHVARRNAAQDAVLASNGQIVCRVNNDAITTNDMPGCSPLNVFGVGVPSRSALDYTSGLDTYQLIRNWQNVEAVSVRGEPFSTWAGPVSLAMGIENRAEKAHGISDALSQANAFFGGNPKGFDGKYNVKEGFAETVVPLAKDAPWARALDFNGALRLTDYSNSGFVTTWKAGVTYQITDEYRFRATRSRDIRAPNMDNLFQAGSVRISVQFDPFTGATPTAFFNTMGNPNLKPEKADTWSAGAVFSPSWLSGFQASVDWYSINIKDAIFTTGAAQVVDSCFKGVAIFCKQLQRDKNGALFQVDLYPENIAAAKTSGIDFETSYSFPIGPGTLRTRLMGTYYLEQSSVQNGVYLDNNGAIGGDTGGPAGYPKLRGTVAATYDMDAISATLQARVIGSAKLNNNWGPKDIDNNHVPGVVYLDLRASYSFPLLGADGRIYISVDDLMDKDPPIVPITATSALPFYNATTNRALYDAIGRTVHIGVRAKF